jgi:hypothetical protein
MGDLANETDGKRHDVVAPFAQRWNADVEDVQPVVQISTKISTSDGIVKIPVRCRDDAHVRANGSRPTEAQELAALQHTQELCLSTTRHFGDLIKKEDTAGRQLNLSGHEVLGAGERAAFVPEELGFKQVLGKRGAVDADELAAPARRPLVNKASDDFFPCARLAFGCTSSSPVPRLASRA